MSFELRPLPYATDALSPWISEETLEIHHGKHHKAYVDNLNGLVAGTELESKSLEEIVKTAEPGPVFNNAAQVWNHAFYFESLAPNAGGEPSGSLLEAIVRDFRSFETFKAKFSETAVKTFGSGWGWLVKKPDGSLAVVSTSNAATPLTGEDVPLLTCDVWEHAYYVDYRNRRAEYVEKFWNLVNWKKVSERYGAQSK
jgi:Fe-Mn family superoxide dismutase